MSPFCHQEDTRPILTAKDYRTKADSTKSLELKYSSLHSPHLLEPSRKRSRCSRSSCNEHDDDQVVCKPVCRDASPDSSTSVRELPQPTCFKQNSTVAVSSTIAEINDKPKEATLPKSSSAKISFSVSALLNSPC